MSVESDSGENRLEWVSLINPDGEPVETVPQAVSAVARLRTQRTDNALPVLGRTPTFADYADTYLATIKAAKEIFAPQLRVVA